MEGIRATNHAGYQARNFHRNTFHLRGGAWKLYRFNKVITHAIILYEKKFPVYEYFYAPDQYRICPTQSKKSTLRKPGQPDRTGCSFSAFQLAVVIGSKKCYADCL